MRDGVITLEGPVGNFTKGDADSGVCCPTTRRALSRRKKAYVPVDYAHLKPVMQVKDFSGYGFSNITFDLYPGEILRHCGRRRRGPNGLISTIFGRDKTLGGKVILDGRTSRGAPTKEGFGGRHQLRAGRPSLPRHFQNPLDFFKHDLCAAQRSKERRRGEHESPPSGGEIAQKYVNDFRTKIVSLEDQIGSLSGGNQQKVVIARALSTIRKSSFSMSRPAALTRRRAATLQHHSPAQGRGRGRADGFLRHGRGRRAGRPRDYGGSRDGSTASSAARKSRRMLSPAPPSALRMRGRCEENEEPVSKPGG